MRLILGLGTSATSDNGANDEQLKFTQSTLRELTNVFDLRLAEKKGSSEVEAKVNVLIAERNEARKLKQWALSDQIRDHLKEMGVTIQDSKDGTKWRWSRQAFKKLNGLLWSMSF